MDKQIKNQKNSDFIGGGGRILQAKDHWYGQID